MSTETTTDRLDREWKEYKEANESRALGVVGHLVEATIGLGYEAEIDTLDELKALIEIRTEQVKFARRLSDR